MSSQIFLIRHPETTNNKAGIIEDPVKGNLSERGKSQIPSAVKKLLSLKITKAYASDSMRCKELAETFSKESGLPVRYKKILREVNSGEWIGMKKSDVKKLIAQNKKPRNAEHFPELMERAKFILQKMNAEHGCILLITHACLIKMIVGATKGMDAYEADKVIHVKNCEIIDLKTK